jgi:cellulose synthase/poly-beta-1,6-N-acetylglucosamine synthase-like glycosyltransferase
MLLENAMVAAFWLCVGLVVYAYAVYPFVIWVLSRLGGSSAAPQELSDDQLPRVSLLVAAYNEQPVIGQRVSNALAMSYPPEKLQVVVASDGSSDRTAEIVRGVDDPRIRLLDYSHRRGKASVLNSAMSEVTGEIVLLSDANTEIDPQAARRLLRWFVDPTVGAVCGRLVLVDPCTGRNVDGLYWKYETFLKKCEGRLGALLGSNGAIYAIRKELYQPIPPDTIVDDFVIPLLARLRTGCRIVYDCAAFATEDTPPDVGSEFHRRSRIGAGGFQSIFMLWRLLDPRQGYVAFTFFSHKILRWLCPFFMIGAVLASALLWEAAMYRVLLLTQLAFFTVSALAVLVPRSIRLPLVLRVSTMFTLMNAALLVGFFRWARGRQNGTWRRTARSTEIAIPPQPVVDG